MSKHDGLWATKETTGCKPFVFTGEVSSSYFGNIGFNHVFILVEKGWNPTKFKTNLMLGPRCTVEWND